MENIKNTIQKYKIQILVVLIILLLIPIIKITFDKINKNYNVETVSREKYFVLSSKNKEGVIDEKGNIVIEPEYYEIHIPNPSKPIFVCYYDYNEETGNCRTKVINEQGTELFTKYNHIETIELNSIETTMPYEKNILKYKKDNLYGIISIEGEIITKPIYESIEGLSCKEGELLVKEDNKYGVINNRGVELIKIKYDYISGDGYYAQQDEMKSSGYIVGEKTSEGYRYGYITSEQKKLLDTQYSDIIRIEDVENKDTDKNIFIIARKNGQCGLLKNKKVMIDFKYQDINYSGVDNLFIVTRGKKLGVYNSKGKKILDTKYDDIEIEEEYIYVKNDDEENYYDLKGNLIDKNSIQPKEYEEDSLTNAADKVNPTLTPKEKDGKWGFIDKNGSLKVDYIYDEVTRVNKYGYAGIKKNGKWGSIDEKGNIIQEPIYNLDEFDEIDFIGKYYKVIYDYKNIYYSDAKF